jgi:hypothetical protein
MDLIFGQHYISRNGILLIIQDSEDPSRDISRPISLSGRDQVDHEKETIIARQRSREDKDWQRRD